MRTQNLPNSVDYTTFSQKFKQNLETLKDILGSETEINDLVHFLQGADGNIDIALNQILNSNERGKQPSKDIIKPSSPDKSPPDPLQAVLKQISEEVKCSYCLGYFREPVILGCLHSFCLDCVEEIVVKNSINCPLCRTVTRLNTGSVDELKRNHYLANIAEAIKSSKLTQMCSSCKSTMCTVYCNECKTVYCFSCNDNIHSSALLAGHKRIPFEECFSLARDKSISDWVIPFEVKKSLCSELFRRWVQQLWFAPADLISIAILENFETVYVPFWIFDVDVVINYMTTNIPTRWRYPIAPSDSITTSFPDILICGVESAESSFIDAIGPWSLDLMENSTFKHTEGVEVRSYSILETEAWERAKEKLEVLCKGICLQRIQKNAVIQPQQLGQVNIKNQFTNKKTRRLFLPVYRTSYTYKNRSYRLIINGSTGKVHGERPYSTNPLPLPNIVSGMNYLFSKLSKTSH